MSFLFPQAPSVPTPPPPPPTLNDPAITATASQAQAAAAAASGKGFNKTIKTSAQGAPNPNTAGTNLFAAAPRPAATLGT